VSLRASELLLAGRRPSTRERYGPGPAPSPAWQAHEIRSGRLITGQNPASATPAAEALVAALAGSAA